MAILRGPHETAPVPIHLLCEAIEQLEVLDSLHKAGVYTYDEEEDAAIKELIDALKSVLVATMHEQ